MAAVDPESQGAAEVTPKDLYSKLRRVLRVWRAVALRAELRIAPTESQRLFILTIVLGLVCGFAAVAFHLAIFFADDHLISRAMRASGKSWMVWTIITPTVGGLVSGALLQYVFPKSRGSGVPQVKVAFASREGVVTVREAIGKFFVGVLQIGTGSSLGLEGPTVQICAGVSSLLGKLMQVSPQSRRRLIPVGAAAGIAAAFNAPIAAVTFTIEEVVGQLDQTVLSGVIIAAALSAVIERSVLGSNPVLGVPEHFSLSDPRSLLLYAALGVAAAGVSVTFTDGLLKLRLAFRKLKFVPAWAHPAVGAGATGLLAVVVLAVFHKGGVTGGGYAVLEESLRGSLGWRVLCVLCVAKIASTVFSYSSGGAGGIFAPALFMGGTLGGAFGYLDSAIFHHSDVGAFALVGMGAVFSATIRAPMTSVLIIVEMTSGYGLILPLMIANMSAYILARQFRPEPVYEALLAQDGIHLGGRAMLDALEYLKLDKLIAHEGTFVTFRRTALPSELLRKIGQSPQQGVFPVVNEDGKLLGLITPEDVGVLEAEPELELVVNASDLMRTPPISVRREDDLRTVYELMQAESLRQVPVLDETDHIIGLVDETEIAQAYLHATGGPGHH